MDSVNMPGVQAAVVKDGAVVWARSYGLAVASPLPERAMADDTVCQLASVSKALIAVAFAQRVEAGALGFDDDINLALPWPLRNPRFPDVPITWRMVLSHSASFYDPPASLTEPIVFGGDSPVPFADFIADVFTPSGRYYGDGPFTQASPGTEWLYSNFGVALAAYAIEHSAGQPFHDYVRENIIEPLGIERTSYFLADLPVENLAVGYVCDARLDCAAVGSTGGDVMAHQYSHAEYPAHLLRSSAVEYSKLMAMLLDGGLAGGAAILSPASLDVLLAPTAYLRDDGTRQGLVFQELPGAAASSDAIVWGLTGTDAGVAAAAFFDRSSGVGAVAFGNGQDEHLENREQMKTIVGKLLAEFR